MQNKEFVASCAHHNKRAARNPLPASAIYLPLFKINFSLCAYKSSSSEYAFKEKENMTALKGCYRKLQKVLYNYLGVLSGWTVY